MQSQAEASWSVLAMYSCNWASLLVGCVLAGFVTVAMFSGGAPAWLVAARDDVTLAHALVNVGGWVGLSMAGTLVTLGPTMLRTRIDPGAVSAAVGALPWLCGGVLVAAGAACAGWMPGIGLGLLVFAVAAALGVVVPLLRVAREKAPRAYATWTMSAGLAWVLGLTPAPAVRLLVVGLVAVGTVLDALSDATVRTAAIRITTLRGRRP